MGAAGKIANLRGSPALATFGRRDRLGPPAQSEGRERVSRSNWSVAAEDRGYL
jgi:hypothetical protein